MTPPSKHDKAVSAVLDGIKNTFVRGPAFGRLDPSMRWAGGTALVTGASAGLGYAIAVELARRGMRVIGVARTATPELNQRLRQESGSEAIELWSVDLSDLDRIEGLVARLAEEGVMIDLLVNNAALVPTADQRTTQGLEQMFVVNYLASFALVRALLERGLFAEGRERAPRILFVASEAHRNAKQVDVGRLGEYEAFEIGKVLELYGTYKLALVTLASELSRRLEAEGICVHSICPGAVDSKLAREAPRWSQPLIRIMFTLFFQAPSKAAAPCLYLCLAPQLEGQTGVYLHQWVRKEPDPRALDRAQGQALWDASEALLVRMGH